MIFFLLNLVFVASVSMEERIQETFLNMIRMNPIEYQIKYGVQFACDVNLLEPIYFDDDLKKASDVQLSYVTDSDCPFAHETCYKYCHIYESCSMESRVKFYCKDCYVISENIMKGPKMPIESLHLFLQKEGHCQNIFDVNHNVMAVTFHEHPNIYIQTFAHKPPFFHNTPFVGDGCLVDSTYYIIYVGFSTVYLRTNTDVYEMDVLFENTYTITLAESNEMFYFTDGVYETKMFR